MSRPNKFQAQFQENQANCQKFILPLDAKLCKPQMGTVIDAQNCHICISAMYNYSGTTELLQTKNYA